MNLVELGNSWIGPSLGMALARLLPQSAAYKLLDRLATRMASQSDSPVTRAVRANQAAARGLPLDDPSLDKAVFGMYREAGRVFISLAKAASAGRQAIMAVGQMHEGLVTTLQELQAQGNGLIIAGAHTAGFDILLLSLGEYGFPIQVLSPPDPRGAYRTQNALRRRHGLDVTPISVASLRTALKRLRNGGIVLTGIDFPVASGEELRFFDRPTRLPVGHARLALHTGAPIVVALCESLEQPGTYQGIQKAVFRVDTGEKNPDAISRLAQRTLQPLEAHIRQEPSNWLMFQPLWPEN